MRGVVLQGRLLLATECPPYLWCLWQALAIRFGENRAIKGVDVRFGVTPERHVRLRKVVNVVDHVYLASASRSDGTASHFAVQTRSEAALSDERSKLLSSARCT